MVSTNLYAGIKITIPSNNNILGGYLKGTKSLYTRVIIWVNTILNYGWDKTTCTLVPWKQGFRHQQGTSVCIGLPKSLNYIDTKTILPGYEGSCGLGIRGTHLKSFIQDIVDEVAPIKKAPLWG